MPNESSRRQRVLLIEDDDADAMLVERALERFPGFQLTRVERLEAGLHRLHDQPCDIVLLDLSLPDSFGLQGVSRLQTEFPDLPIVVLTGLGHQELPLEALEQGAQDYISKGECSAEMLTRALRYSIQRQQIKSENNRLLAELARQAEHDALTGAINRRSLLAHLEREWQRSTRNAHSLACAMVDIDYFKRINDIYGHAAGDHVLQTVASLLSKSCRTTDLLIRYGGEESLVVLPNTDQMGAVDWAERARSLIATSPIAIDGHSLQLTASFGVAEKLADVDHGNQLVEQADRALRLAKQLGRDRTVCYQETLTASINVQEDPFCHLTAGQIMTPVIVSLEETASLQEATELLLQLRLDSVPVVNGKGQIIGALSEEKLAECLATSDSSQRTVGEVVRGKPVCFSIDVPARAIQEYLSRASTRRVVILDNEQPVGIVSVASILRWRRYHSLAHRSLLDRCDAAEHGKPSLRNLERLVCRIQQEAGFLAEKVLTADEALVELTTATATRLQSLIERTVLHSHDLRAFDQATLGCLVG